MRDLLNLELTLRWQDTRARYRDRRIFGGIDSAGARIDGHRLPALRGADAPVVVADGMLLGPHDPAMQLETAPADWPSMLGGQHIEPRLGRWFPRLVLAGRHGIVGGDHRPLRVVGVAADAIAVDLNAPLAGISFAVDAIASAAAGAGATPGDLLAQLLANGPGMQAALASGSPAAPRAEDFLRSDERSDADFYATPRFVDHLDTTALEQMRALHRRFLAPGMRVLDLMASCDSHFPVDAAGIDVTGLGLNAEELARNPRLARRIVQNLNEEPRLPFATGEFDLALCALSVEYLVHPQEVFVEVARVLRPGGTFLVSFSERWFPPKVIRLWSDLHPFERIGLVLDHFGRSGRFDDLHAESLRGLPRPADDKYYRMTKLSDPIYAVWGKVGADEATAPQGGRARNALLAVADGGTVLTP